jgi:hypothetical protein
MCDTHKSRDHFYVSTDPLIKSGITPICRECARKIALRVDKNGDEHEATKESAQLALRYLNKPFINSLWDASVQESENLVSGRVKYSPWTAYIKNVQMVNYVGMTYFDSDMFKEKIVYEDEKTLQQIVEEAAGADTMDDYLRNKKDVIKLLGYDPFESEAISDQPFLYSQLIGLMDSSQDSDDLMRNQSCVTICRDFLQVQKIDNTITKMMADNQNIERNSATIKSLQDSKQKITSMITNLAAESCISLKNNKNAKKGENTWTGKLKKINDLNLRDGEINGFSLETCKGMQQVADISVQAILKGLRLDESDYSDMLAEQTKMINELTRKQEYYEEISRILLRENIDLRDLLEENNIKEGFELVDLDKLLFDLEDTGEENAEA